MRTQLHFCFYSYVYFLLLFAKTTSFANESCTFVTQTIKPEDRLTYEVEGVYSRKTAFYVTEQSADINRHTLQLLYVASLLGKDISSKEVTTFKALLKKSPKSCSYCDFKAEEIYEIIEKNSKILLNEETLSLDKTFLLDAVEHFIAHIPHLYQEQRSYYSYEIYWMKCVNKETGEESSKRLNQEEIYDYTRMLPPPSLSFHFYVRQQDEEHERFDLVKNFFVRHEKFIDYLFNSKNVSSKAQILIALKYSQKTLNSR